jgi:L-asparaginase II
VTPGSPLVEVTRRDVVSGREPVESVHTGHLAVVGPSGHVVAALGDPRQVTYLRSTAKPFQATACLEILAAEARDVPVPTPAELAVAWSSHRAEPTHLAVVRTLLARSGTDEAQLTCPPAVGEADPTAPPSRLRRDCSGKHALFALVGRTLGVEPGRLLDPTGPLQSRILGGMRDMLGPADAVAIDGCGAPAIAMPLHRLAGGFADLAVAPRFEAVRSAGLAHPDLVGGEGRLETALLGVGVVAKIGAEGVFAAGWTNTDGQPFGLAVKAADGAHRASTAATAALLIAAGVVPEGTWEPPPPLGGGEPQGVVRPSAELQALAASLGP